MSGEGFPRRIYLINVLFIDIGKFLLVGRERITGHRYFSNSLIRHLANSWMVLNIRFLFISRLIDEVIEASAKVRAYRLIFKLFNRNAPGQTLPRRIISRDPNTVLN